MNSRWHALALLICAQLSLLVQAGPMVSGGQASVSETGAALYSIPLTVPPGTAGMEPKLSLTYNSQAANGLLGVGWALSGLSVITHCPREIAQDGVKGGINFDANDRFCLDGERLMAISGAEYRTERDSFSKIVSNGSVGSGPAWFQVWTKSGEILEYGNTPDSRIEAQGKASVRVWAVNKVSDINGNYRTVSYTKDSVNGYYYPSAINYSGTTASVQFDYEPRPDQSVLYLGGSLVKPTLRISKIVAKVNNSPIREYRLSYGGAGGKSGATNNSLLRSVTECGIAGALTTCLPSVTATWAESPSALENRNPSDVINDTLPSSYFFNVQWLVGDINGDGRDDLVMVWRDVSTNNIGRQTWLADASGNFAASTYSVTESGWSPQTLSNMQFALADTNGDGRKDLVWTWTTPVGHLLGTNLFGRVVWLANADGSFPASYSSTSTTSGFTPNLYANQRVFYGDMNGDGRDDLIWTWTTTDNFLGRVVWLANSDGSYLSTPSSQVTNETGYSPQLAASQHWLLGDVSGDGLPDLVWFWADAGTGPRTIHRVVWLAQPGGSFSSTSTSHETEDGFTPNSYGFQRVFLTDVNGDGRMDLSWAWTFSTTNAGPGRVVWVSKGDGTFGARTAFTEEVIPGFNASFCNQNVTFHSLDINGDHRSDLLLTCTNQNELQRVTWMTNPDGGTPSTYSSSVSEPGFTIVLNMNSDRLFAVGDTNGDGKGDLIWAWRNSASGTAGRITHRATSGAVDQVTRVDNGIGAATTFAYKPLTDATVYTKDTGTAAATYPNRDLQVPLYVVGTMKESNDIGGDMTHAYTYGGAKTNLQGRGFLGFRFINANQVDTGLATRTDYRQDWPYHGLAAKVTKTTASGGSGGLLERQTNSYACNDFNGGCSVVAGRRYFPYLSSRTDEKWDLDGAAFKTMTTTQQFDIWGNPFSFTVSASDGFSKTTTNTYTYTNHATGLLLGRLTESVVTSSTPHAEVSTVEVCPAPPPPSVPVALTSVAPNVGPLEGGTAITLSGSNFVASATVTIGGTATSCNFLSDTSITCTTPAGTPGAQNVVVTQDGNSATLPGGYAYVGPPTLTGINPNAIPTAGGWVVQVQGTNLQFGFALTIGGTTTYCGGGPTPACVLPPGTAGVHNVVVTNAAGSATLTDGFTYVAPPTLTGIAPNIGLVAGGTPVTLTGTNFRAGMQVEIGVSSATGCSMVSPTTFTCTTPPGTAGAQVVAIHTLGGDALLTGGFTYLAAPTLASITPSAGPMLGGTPFTLTGTNFVAGATVTIGGYAATGCNTVSATSITCATPGPAGTTGARDVVVTTVAGSATLTGGFAYQYLSPTLTSVAPNSGPAAGGTAITLTGTNFVTSATVRIGPTNNAIGCNTVSATSITCTTPAGNAGARNVVVTQGSASVKLDNGFTYLAALTLTSIAPNAGPLLGGTPVTLTGAGFVAGATVTIGGTAATGCNTVSATRITCTTPAGTVGAQNVVVTQAGGSAALTGGFTYQVAPTLTSIVPNAGPVEGGTPVTLTGANFVAGATVTIGSTAAMGCNTVSATSITCTTPARTVGAQNVVVTLPGGSATLTAGFTYQVVAPTLISIVPNAGPVEGGTPVILTGTNFVAGATVTIGSTAAMGCNTVSATSITCTTPADTAGAQNVVVAQAGGSATLSGGYTYTYVSSLPTPSIEYLVVGGGGGGFTGTNYTGGGGGGQVVAATGLAVVAGSALAVTVGVGGGDQQQGGTSSFNGISAIGGGYGAGAVGATGGTGASGGGGAKSSGAGGTGTAGYNGGNGVTYSASAGGGGGASAAGGNAAVGFGGRGGEGITSGIDGTARVYGSGGGGGGMNGLGEPGTNAGRGGYSVLGGSNAPANFGGGAGGNGYDFTSSTGGSGVVIIRYPVTYQPAIATTGSPTVTVTGGYRIYKWTAVGTGSVTF